MRQSTFHYRTMLVKLCNTSLLALLCWNNTIASSQERKNKHHCKIKKQTIRTKSYKIKQKQLLIFRPQSLHQRCWLQLSQESQCKTMSSKTVFLSLHFLGFIMAVRRSQNSPLFSEGCMQARATPSAGCTEYPLESKPGRTIIHGIDADRKSDDFRIPLSIPHGVLVSALRHIRRSGDKSRQVNWCFGNCCRQNNRVRCLFLCHPSLSVSCNRWKEYKLVRHYYEKQLRCLWTNNFDGQREHRVLVVHYVFIELQNTFFSF